MTLRLGPSPDDLEITLIPGASWWTTLVSVDDTAAQTPVPYPTGVTIELRIAGMTFAAVVVGAEATIRLTPMQVSNVIAAQPLTAGVWWSNGIDTLPWALGPVYIDG